MPAEDASIARSDWNGRIFQTTHWSVVLRVGEGHSDEAMQALEKLCRTYWFPIYAFVRKRGYSPEQADDRLSTRTRPLRL